MEPSPEIPELIIHPDDGSYQSTLDKLYEQQQQNLYTDFVIKVDEQEIPCHRNVMATACPYFNKLFSTSTVEAWEQKVDALNFQHNNIQNVVKFCYGQKIVISYNDIRATYEAFDYYQLSGFKGTFIAYILENINPATCIGWCEFGAKHGLHKVESDAWKCVHEKFSVVSQYDEFLGMDFTDVVDLILKDRERYKPDEILQGCIRWLQTQEHNAFTLGMFLKHMDLSSCSLAYLLEILSIHKNKAFLGDESYLVVSKVVVSKSLRRNTVVVVGGRALGCNHSKECNMLSLETGKASQLTSVPASVSLLCVCRARDGFAVIGHRHSTAGVMCFLYNQVDNSWTELPPPWVDECSSMTCVESTLFTLGSRQEVDFDVHSLDLNAVDKQWLHHSPMAKKMQTPILTSNQTSIFAMWNTASNEQELDDVPPMEMYDVSSDLWSHCADLPQEITNTSGCVAVATSKHMFLLGGGANLALRYSVSDKQWTRLSRPSSLHSYGAAAVLEDRIVLCGGLKDPTTLSDVVEYYESLRDEWKMSDVTLPSPVWQHYISVV